MGSIEEFVALRPKQYSFITENDEVNKEFKKDGKLIKAKGLSKESVKNYITHQMYVDQVLKDEKIVSCKMSNLQSKNFQLYTQYIWKKALLNYENKRSWLDSIYSLPFGHPWINKIENGIMKIEDAVDQLRGEDNYTYELNAYKQEQNKKEKQTKTAELYVSVTNLSEEQLKNISDKCYMDKNLKEKVTSVLSNPNGILLFREFIQEKEIEIDF